MKDALARTIRTFLQAAVGSLAVSGVLSAMAVTGVVDWAMIQKAGYAALAAGIVAVVTFVQNTLENAGAVPTVLKPAPVDPIPAPQEPVL